MEGQKQGVHRVPVLRSQTQLTNSFWVQDYPDPQDYCTLLLHSGQAFNIGGWSNPRYDRLVEQADVEFDRKKRAQLYIQAQHIALGAGAWISLDNTVGQSRTKRAADTE